MMINKRLINLCKDSKKYIVLTVLSNWVSVLCNIAIVIILGNIINKVYLKESINSVLVTKYSIGIGLLLCARVACNILYTKFSSKASSNARVKLRELLYKKLLKLGTKYTEVESTSSVVQVAVEGIEQLEVYFGKYLPQFFYAMLVPITLFIVMCFISFRAAIVFILCVPLIPMSIIAIMKIAKKILKDYWKSYSDLGGTFLENLQGLTTLKVFHIDEERHKKMNEESEKFRRITMKVLSMQLNSITIMDLVAFGGSAVGTITALYQLKSGSITVGILFIIILLSSEFFIPLRLLGSYFHIAMNGMVASDRIFGILDAEIKNDKDKNYKIKNNENINVELKDISFSYDGKRNVLENMNMGISNKGLTAIVGESGSGKSTIASLILNEERVSKGRLFINGINIDDISLDSIYENMTIVSTNSYIFTGTILDNLLIAKENATEEEIMDALKKARLYDFVNELKDGLHTEVSSNGSSLSGGQKQRLALARAILSDRKMIIFDEATSNIDVESEESIWQSIYELAEEKTILVISHRLANVVNAKNIYVMSKGKIVEEGTHSELVNNKSHYYNMVNIQNELELARKVN